LKKTIKYLVFVAIATFVLVGLNYCTLEKSVSGKNISFLYKEEVPKLLAETNVFNSEGKTRILLKFKADDFGKSRADNGGDLLSYSLRYKIYENYSSPVVLDSGKVIRKGVSYFGGEFFFDSIRLSSVLGRNYLVECVINDLNSGQRNTQLIDVNRSLRFNAQSIRVRNSENELMFNDYLVEVDSYFIELDVPRQRLFVKYYSRDFPAASPPFSTIAPRPFDFTPDDIDELHKLGETSFKLIVSRPGFYQITDDTNRKTGGTLYYFGVSYPQAKTLLDLVNPVRYITTNDEYEEILASENLKKSVDAYWLNIGDNPQRARELIRAFYSRVQYANTYFTSYLEGWKSDRGMCYIVYGPPDVVYRSTATETWLYGEEGNYNSLSLTFTRVVNPFTTNDYRLNRSGSLKTSWYRAVEYWRQGRVLTYR
jgi:GWxTD domain-containing protein